MPVYVCVSVCVSTYLIAPLTLTPSSIYIYISTNESTNSPPSAILRVSDHMGEIEQYVRALRDGGCAYEVMEEKDEKEGRGGEEGGQGGKAGVYFDVGAMSNYGKLGSVPPPPDDNSAHASADGGGGSGTPTNTAKNQSDYNQPQTQAFKRSHRDFSLWKNAKAGEPRWSVGVKDMGGTSEGEGGGSASLSAGRPGWHIECR